MRTFTTVLAVVLLANCPCLAEVITQRQSVTGSEELVFQQFDPALGSLTKVEFGVTDYGMSFSVIVVADPPDSYVSGRVYCDWRATLKAFSRTAVQWVGIDPEFTTRNGWFSARYDLQGPINDYLYGRQVIVSLFDFRVDANEIAKYIGTGSFIADFSVEYHHSIHASQPHWPPWWTVEGGSGHVELKYYYDPAFSLPPVQDIQTRWGQSDDALASAADVPIQHGIGINRLEIFFENGIPSLNLPYISLNGDRFGDYLKGATYKYDYDTLTATITLDPASAIGSPNWDAIIGGHGDHLTLSLMNGTHVTEFSVLPGDVSGDGVVNVSDLVLIRNNSASILGSQYTYNPLLDVDGNGAIDLDDLLDARARLRHTLAP